MKNGAGSRPKLVAAILLRLLFLASAVLPAHAFPIALGGDISTATAGFTTRWMDSYAYPLIPTVYARFLDSVEAGAIFGTAVGAYLSFSPVMGVELRLAPHLGNYQPFVGAGFWYSSVQYTYTTATDTMTLAYVTAAPLRFSLRSFLQMTGRFSVTVSLCEIRYGPIVPDNSLPSYIVSGNFLLMVDLLRVGVLYELGEGRDDAL